MSEEDEQCQADAELSKSVNLDVAEVVGIELLHDQCGVLVDVLQDLGQLVGRGGQSEALMMVQEIQKSSDCC